MALFYPSAIALLLLVVGCSAQSGYLHDNVQASTNPSWMANICDSKKLSQLSLVGTHDSGAYCSVVCGGDIAQTQSMSITNQLNSGVRVLDIRNRHIKNAFDIHHGIAYQNLNFDQVLTQVSAFLKAQPKETVLMGIQEEYEAKDNTRSFEATLQAYVDKYPGLFAPYISDNPTLGQVRGKVVIIDNFSGATATKKWGLKNTNWVGNGLSWVIPDNWGLYGRWEAVKKHYVTAANGPQDTFYTNALTASNGAFPYFVASGNSDPSTNGPNLLTGSVVTSNDAKWADFPRVGCFIGLCSIAFEGLNELSANRACASGCPVNPRVGIIYADFPGKRLIDKVIGFNKIGC